MENAELRIERKNVLLEKSYSFSLSIVNFSLNLQNNANEYVLSKQLIRSGTSIGAMCEEAQQAESRKDFIHKLAIANKEAHEAQYWLRLIRDSNIKAGAMESLISQVEELKRMLISIIKTAKARK